jgi:hypothetical protein
MIYTLRRTLSASSLIYLIIFMKHQAKSNITNNQLILMSELGWIGKKPIIYWNWHSWEPKPSFEALEKGYLKVRKTYISGRGYSSVVADVLYITDKGKQVLRETI